MKENRTVVGIGEVLWDILPDGKKIGGAPANFAYHVSQFGLQSLVVSAIGDDALGQEIISTFRDKGLNSLISTVPYPTGTVQVELDMAGIPQYIIKEGVAWDYIPFTPELEALARNTCAVCFGSLAQRSTVSRNTINRFIDTMPKDNGTLIVFDANLRQSFYSEDVLEQSMTQCNVLKINDEELPTVCRISGIPESDPENQCRALLNLYNLKILILTCGVNGSYIFTPDAMSFLPTPQVKVADTVGAGDSFTAAFTASILSGLPVPLAHRKAVDISAFVCTQNGAMPVLPRKRLRGYVLTRFQRFRPSLRIPHM